MFWCQRGVGGISLIIINIYLKCLSKEADVDVNRTVF